MPTSRNRLVCLDETPYYHCVSRCVRRAFLCGRDPATGFDFEHRRQWIVDRIVQLCAVFAVDLCAYAVMSNHYHIVLRIDTAEAMRWTEREVAQRWTRLFSTPELIHRYLGYSPLSAGESERVAKLLATWRQRLHDLSWFMRCLNEPIARLANREDHCTGRFWEGRFSSQALLDERALLACMAYVDLNPVRAGLAPTPEESDFTSVQERVRHPDRDVLCPFSGNSNEPCIPFALTDYLDLVDWAGRAIRCGKKGRISASQPPILQRLHMESAPVLIYLSRAERFPPVAVGPVSRLRDFAQTAGRRFIKGLGLGRDLCPETG
jgi:REP element-mobilizing transposase RayT